MKSERIPLSHADVKHFTAHRAQQGEVEARESIRQMGKPPEKAKTKKPERGTPGWAHELAACGTGDGM